MHETKITSCFKQCFLSSEMYPQLSVLLNWKRKIEHNMMNLFYKPYAPEGYDDKSSLITMMNWVFWATQNSVTKTFS